MALYRNISKKAEYICSNMTKILVQPGGIVDLTMRDLQHCSGALRFFESVIKAKIVADRQMMSLKKRQVFDAKKESLIKK